MSDAREPSARNPDGDNPASGRRSEQSKPVSDAREPSPGGDERDSGHVDLETLAELAEGVEEAGNGPPDRHGGRAGHARAHLATCPHCQQRAADLAEVRQVLAAAPGVAMPDEVAARIDAAIAAAAEQDEDDAAVVRPSPVRRPWYQRRPLQVGLAAAAVVVLAVGGVATTRAILTGGGAVTSAGSGATDGRERAPEAGQAPAEALSGSGNSRLHVVATDTNYSASKVDEQVSRLVRRRMAQGSTGEARPDAGRTPEALLPLADAGRLHGCVGRATGDADRRPVVVDLARYEAEPAAVLVFSDRGQQGQLDLLIVGASCSAHDADVLLHTQVAR